MLFRVDAKLREVWNFCFIFADEEITHYSIPVPYQYIAFQRLLK
tara:strand:+ start:753 stop:884 length:132 start_codon:yes stop_codon:yes gene_type:complete